MPANRLAVKLFVTTYWFCTSHHIVSQQCFTCCKNSKKAIKSCGAFISHQIMWGIHKPIYAAQLKLSLLTPGLIKYESYTRIYQTRYQISAPTLIFSLTSVTPCKLTYLVYPCKNCREIKNVTLKWHFEQDIFNNIHKKWPFTHIYQPFFMTEHIVILHNTFHLCWMSSQTHSDWQQWNPDKYWLQCVHSTSRYLNHWKYLWPISAV